MNVDNFAKWLRHQGYLILKTQSGYWFNPSPRVLQAFPFHHLISPSDQELHRLLIENRCFAARYSTYADATKGIDSYHVVYKGEKFELEKLPKKVRNDVKRGLANVSIKRIELEQLATEGWDLRKETIVRQGRSRAESAEWWYRLCISGVDIDGVYAWGAFVANELVAAVLTFKCDNYLLILHQLSRTEVLKLGVNNALTYSCVNYALDEMSISQIFYGLHSLDAPPSVDEFKFRMGFEPQKVKQRVIFHPFLLPLINHRSLHLIHALRQSYPGRTTLAKLEGMMRFALEISNR